MNDREELVIGQQTIKDISSRTQRLGELKVEKLNRKNARSWFYRFERYLKSEKCWGAIVDKDTYSESVYAQMIEKLPGYNQREKVTQNLILEGLQDSTMDNRRIVTDVWKLWNILKDRFLNPTASERIRAREVVIRWKKNSRHSDERELEEIKSLAQTAKEITNQEVKKKTYGYTALAGCR